MWARHVRRHGEPAVNIEAYPGSGVGHQEDQSIDDKLRVKEDEEYLFGDDSDEDDRQSHPAFSEDERIDPEGRAGTVAVQNHGEAGSGVGPYLPEELSGSRTERLCRVDLCEVFPPPRV